MLKKKGFMALMGDCLYELIDAYSLVAICGVAHIGDKQLTLSDINRLLLEMQQWVG